MESAKKGRGGLVKVNSGKADGNIKKLRHSVIVLRKVRIIRIKLAKLCLLNAVRHGKTW